MAAKAKIAPVRLLAITLAVVVVVQLLWAAWLPVLGDEAYYALWGRELRGGYYDLPPMVGWINHFSLFFGHSRLALRIPPILMSLGTALLTYVLLRKKNPERAAVTAALLGIAPFHWLPIIMMTDTPMWFFSFVAVALFARAVGAKKNSRSYALAAGTSLGAAFLSKYFAVLLIIPFALVSPRLAAWATLATVPFVLQHLEWNSRNCWINLAFNLYTRNEGEGFEWRKPWRFALFQLYLGSPFLLAHAVLLRRDLVSSLSDARTRLFALCFAVPLAAFAISSVFFGQGLHWTIGFYPFLILWIGGAASAASLRKALAWMSGYAALHAIILAGAAIYLAHPPAQFKTTAAYRSWRLVSNPEAAFDLARPYLEHFVPTTSSYSMSALASWAMPDVYFAVLGEGSRFGRADDLITDLRSLDGKDILSFPVHDEDMSRFSRYFESAEQRQLPWDQDRSAVIHLGHRFNYAKYRDEVLQPVRDHWYSRPIPTWLPRRGCPFTDKYFSTVNK